MEFLALVKKKTKLLDLDQSLLNRSVNEGFSGGEKKRNEIFQMAVLEPKLAILDETDSGLDIDALKVVAGGVNKLRRPDNATLVITHYQRLLNYIVPDIVHVLVHGRIVKSGGKELAMELEERGYDWILEGVAVERQAMIDTLKQNQKQPRVLRDRTGRASKPCLALLPRRIPARFPRLAARTFAPAARARAAQLGFPDDADGGMEIHQHRPDFATAAPSRRKGGRQADVAGHRAFYFWAGCLSAGLCRWPFLRGLFVRCPKRGMTCNWAICRAGWRPIRPEWKSI